MKAIIFALIFLFGSTAMAANEQTQNKENFWGEVLGGQVIFPAVKVTPQVSIKLKSSNPRRGEIIILNGSVTYGSREIRIPKQ